MALSWEMYSLRRKNVPNATDPAGIIANGGFPFTPANGINFKCTVFARCANPRQLSCTAEIFATVAYDRGCGFDLALLKGEQTGFRPVWTAGLEISPAEGLRKPAVTARLTATIGRPFELSFLCCPTNGRSRQKRAREGLGR